MQAVYPNGTDRPALAEERDGAIRAELERILHSPSFRGSRRCCRFLEYSVQHVLEGKTQDELRERSLGIEVFGRAPDYDTAEDAIVRVTANEVRKRLAQYYQESGANSDPVITLPPGSYAVAVRWKQVPEPMAPPPPAPPPQPAIRKHWRVMVAAGVLAAAAAGVYIAAISRNEVDRDPLWSRVFQRGKKTNIVIADAARYEIQELLGREFSLPDYLSADYPSNLAPSVTPELQRVIRFMGGRQTTSIASVTTGSRLMEFGQRIGMTPVIRHPRHLNVREFNTDNFILLGSRLSIPWVELFEPWLNFPIIIDPETHEFYLQNRNPRPGEPARFARSPSNDVTYAGVAVLPNVRRTGTVLLLNGIDMVAVEAAGDFAMNGSLSVALARSRVDAVEVLLRVHSIAESVGKSEIVAIREVHPTAGPVR
jgi:hypothetical protein